MLDMARDEQEEKEFIVDIDVIDKELVVTYANGNITHEVYTAHNLNYYRNRMVEQVKSRITRTVDDLAIDSFKVSVKKFLAIVFGVIALFFIYNIDIHVAMKIIITILLALGELGYWFYNELTLDVMRDEVIEGLALEYYIKNFSLFTYFDKDILDKGYFVPIEDVSKYKLSVEMLVDISKSIAESREAGVADKDISLSYKRKEIGTSE